jgi:BASS family bile acid:Na+ symporter
MQSNLFTSFLLPLALAVVMLGMGLSLVPEDFKRITRDPKAVVVGTVCQVLLLPLIGTLITLVVPMQPEIAVGLLVLAVCPGGPSSNLMTYLAKGDLIRYQTPQPSGGARALRCNCRWPRESYPSSLPV